MWGLDRFRDENQQLNTPEISEDIDSPEEPRSRFEVSREVTEGISEVERDVLRDEVGWSDSDWEDNINEFTSRFTTDESIKWEDPNNTGTDQTNPAEDPANENNEPPFEINPEQIHLLREYFEAHKPGIDTVIWDVENEMERVKDFSVMRLRSLHSSFVLWEPFQEDGNLIQSELERILELSDNEQTTITNGEQELTFESKHDALMYLYYIKYSLRQVENFIKTLDDTPYSEAYKIAIISALVAYIGFSTIWSLRRGIRQVWYRLNFWQSFENRETLFEKNSYF